MLELLRLQPITLVQPLNRTLDPRLVHILLLPIEKITNPSASSQSTEYTAAN
jgi:hypothetical protein